LITKNPLFIQIDSSYVVKRDTVAAGVSNDTSKVLQIDTLVIRSLRMEAYRDTLNIFKAEDSYGLLEVIFHLKMILPYISAERVK